MPPKLAPVDPVLLKGLRDHVHAALRRAIISGELSTGSWLNERQMAEQLGVSTTPLKEALRRLEVEGLVVTEPRRGVRVTFDAAQAEEMGLARAALEGMLARQAAARMNTAARARLKDVLARMETATDEGNVDALMELNEEFHDGIHEISQCHYLRRMQAGQRVYSQATREFILRARAERVRALAEHKAIGKALIQGDADAAEQAMRDHVIRSVAHHVRTAFKSREAKAEGKST